MKKLLKKYREIIIYLIVGVLTTIVSWGACFLARICGLNSTIHYQDLIINTIGWAAGVLFAYPLNRVWVFRSTNKNILKEFFGFAASRLGTWILDLGIMALFCNVWKVFLPVAQYLKDHISFLANKDVEEFVLYWFVKICISAVLVTILNYVFSKVLIFSKKKNKDQPENAADEENADSGTEEGKEQN